MSMVLLRGVIGRIGPTEQKTEKLAIMKFVLETDGGPIEVELMNKSIEFFLKSRKQGDKVGVNVEIQGRLSNWNGKDTYFTSLRCANTFPIFTRGDESPDSGNGMASGSSSYGASNSYGSGQSNGSNGSQTATFPTPAQDDLPF